jgi:hypothetical protein
LNSFVDRLLEVLRSHADSSGYVSGTFDDIKDWIGPDAADWYVHELLIQLKDDGEYVGKPYFEHNRFAVTIRA